MFRAVALKGGGPQLQEAQKQSDGTKLSRFSSSMNLDSKSDALKKAEVKLVLLGFFFQPSP